MQSLTENKSLIFLARKRFENFLNEKNICFIKNSYLTSMISARELRWADVVYTVFLEKNSRIEKLYIYLITQVDRKKTEKNTNGVIYLRQPGDVLKSIASSQIYRTFICSYSESDNDLLFKPMHFIKSYIGILEKNFVAKKIKLLSLCVSPKKIKNRFYKKSGDHYYYNCLLSMIKHKIPYIIAEKEMSNFLIKYNNYDSVHKLQFKALNNILGGL